MSNEIKVEKSIPLPRHASRTKYPWDEMEVGDSFVTTSVDGARTSASNRSAKGDKKFITQRTDDGRIRVWRVA